MLNLETSRKSWNEFVAVATTEKAKELRVEVRSILGQTVADTFAGIELSPQLKAYCKTLLVAELVANLKKDFISTHKADYADVDITFDEKMEITSYFRHVADVAIDAGTQEIKGAQKLVEVNVLSHINNHDYVIMGTDFSSVGKELELALHSKGNATLKEFNNLMVIVYGSQLSNKKQKEVKDTVIRAFNETLRDYSFNSLEELRDTSKRTRLIEKAGRKVNMKRLEQQFLSCVNKSYVIKPQILIDLEQQATQQAQ